MRAIPTRTPRAGDALLISSINRGYTACMNSYTTVCQQVPAARDFDSSQRQGFSNVFRNIDQSNHRRDDHRPRDPVNDDYRGPRNFNNGDASVHVFNAVCKFLAELSKDVVNIIASSKEELSKSVEINDLVDLYYESTNRTLDLFSTVENCVNQAESSQRRIRVAIQRFETESMGTNVGGNNRYAVTLEELNRVKAMGDPFGDEFATQYEAVYDGHVNLLNTLREMQEELDKNQSHVQNTRTKVVKCVVFAATLFTALALSMFSLTLVSPAVVASVVAGLAVSGPVAGAGIWVTVMLNDYDRALATQKALGLLTGNRTKLNFEAMRTIRNQVGTLIIKISSILDNVEVAVERREDEAVRLVMQEIIQKVEEFAEIINELSENVARCRQVVVSGKNRVLAHMDQLH